MKRYLLLALIGALLLTLVPAASAQAAPSEGGCRKVYVVKRGDMLSIIAARFGVSTKALANANNIRNYNKIYRGQRLCIPGKKSYQPPPPPPKHQPSSGACVYHVVKRGQSLAGIARWYGVNMWTIAKKNGIPNPNRIYPGQTLVIKCKSKPPPHQMPPHPYPPPGYYPPPPHPGDPSAPACSITPVHGFGNIWYYNPQVRDALGCPTETENGFTAGDQAFKNAYVVSNQDGRQIYVLFNNGTWVVMPNTWQEGDPIVNPYLHPPYGWYQPTYGVGKMWRNDDNFSQRMGWAKVPHVRPVQATKQRYDYGEMLWTSSRGIFVLYDSGSWRHFN